MTSNNDISEVLVGVSEHHSQPHLKQQSQSTPLSHSSPLAGSVNRWLHLNSWFHLRHRQTCSAHRAKPLITALGPLNPTLGYLWRPSIGGGGTSRCAGFTGWGCQTRHTHTYIPLRLLAEGRLSSGGSAHSPRWERAVHAARWDSVLWLAPCCESKHYIMTPLFTRWSPNVSTLLQRIRVPVWRVTRHDGFIHHWTRLLSLLRNWQCSPAPPCLLPLRNPKATLADCLVPLVAEQGPSFHC